MLDQLHTTCDEDEIREIEQQQDSPTEYEPSYRVELQPFFPLCTYYTPLELFLQFFTFQCIDILVTCTNAAAVRGTTRNPLEWQAKHWTPVTRNQLLRWLGIRFIMTRENTPIRDSYWNPDTHNLGRFMGRDRWVSIDYYLSTVPVDFRSQGKH